MIDLRKAYILDFKLLQERDPALERFPAKWTPVRVKKTRQIKK
jgi:hypothetical protein